MIDGFKKLFNSKLELVKYWLSVQNRDILKDIEAQGVHYPRIKLVSHSGFGEGKDGWKQFHIGTVSAAQYMSPQLITGNTRLRNSTHYNLCGELAVIAHLGIDLGKGINTFATIPGGTEILNNNMTTSGYHLMDFIAKASTEYKDLEITRNSYAINTPEKMAELLAGGDILIALVNIDTTQEGKLMGLNYSIRDIAHWVLVQEISIIQDTTLVRVYNPFMNREEVYLWETFLASYSATKGNYSQYLAVHGTKTK